MDERAPASADTKLLVAEDDAELLALLGFALRNAGFDVITAVDGTRALERLEHERFGLAVLDINMPGADGFAVCAQLRRRSTMPVIMLSARNQEADIVRALEIGADDYITKPFSPRTLIARIQALLRRSTAAVVNVIEAGDATLDIERRALQVGPQRLNLTPLETSVLQLLLTNAGRLVATDRLATAAWGRVGPDERHTLKQVVYRLRRKLEEHTGSSDLLQSTRNSGYRWVERAALATSHPPL